MLQFTTSLGTFDVIIFGMALVVIAALTPEFRFLDDYVSELGATGHPYAIWWNLIGFLLVGLILTVFDFAYARLVKDRGICLALSGIGFASTAFSIDLNDLD